MIFGRPTNLWLGLVTAGVALVQGTVVTVVPDVNPTAVATVGALVTAFLGAGIALVAGQPPTLAPGDSYNISTPKGQPNYEATVATPPAPTTPTPDPGSN